MAKTASYSKAGMEGVRDLDQNNCKIKKCAIKLHRINEQRDLEKPRLPESFNIRRNGRKVCEVRLRKIKLSSDGDVEGSKKLDKKFEATEKKAVSMVKSSDGDKKGNPRLKKNSAKCDINEGNLGNNKGTGQKLEKASESKDVYEFLSQSSLSEQEDPASDVVKKLIKTGKATVARPRRGKGKQQNIKKAPNQASRAVNRIKNGKLGSKGREPQKRFQVENINLGSSEIEICNKVNGDVVHQISDHHNENNLQNPETPIATGIIFNKQSKEAPRSRPMVTDKVKLLQAAKNFVNQSTPVNKRKIVQPDSHLSPISVSSPWRPPDERVLPRVFYFWRNEDDLPSYSSDVIPSSQTIKEKSVANLSDIENISPPTTNKNTIREKVVSNPRKTLGYRSPLKSINVLDVTALSPRTNAINNITKIPIRNSSLSTLSLKTKQTDVNNIQNNSNFDISNISVENCFGFNDFDDDEKQDAKKPISNRTQLKAKLKNLKRLLPPKPTRASYSKIKSIFSAEPKQKDIREMLTSTIVESRDKKIDTNPSMGFDESINITFGSETQNNTTQLHLFDDLDEPKTIENSATIKTYARQMPKRRRKVLNNVLFSDDESDGEIEEEEKEERPQKKKRTKPIDKKVDAELNQFVEEFNSMCEEVERYELQIEKA